METIDQLREETVTGLRRLARMNHDAAEGYSDAAERVDDERCAHAFRAAAEERERARDELQRALEISDEELPEGGTALGFFHRCWLNAKGALTGGDTRAVLAEVSRGETALVDAYQDVLVDTASSPLNETLHRQLVEIKATRDAVDDMNQRLG